MRMTCSKYKIFLQVYSNITRIIMGVTHSNRHDRSCPLNGEGKIIMIFILLFIMFIQYKYIRLLLFLLIPL